MKHIVNAKVESEPGVEAAYHAVTGGFVIAEMIRAVTGKNLRHCCKKPFVSPWGCRTFLMASPLSASMKWP